MTAAASDTSGRSQVVVTKDTTVKLSWGALAAIILYVGGASWWFSEVRQTDRDRVNGLATSLSGQISSLTFETNRQLDLLKTDLTVTTKTFEAYKSRADNLDNSVQEMRVIRHRLDQHEIASASQDRRMSVDAVKLEEAHRKIAEHAIVIDYIVRWLNPPEPPKKRNDLSPFKYGRNERDDVANQ